MKRTMMWSLAVLAVAGLTVFEPVPARSADEICPMGGVMVKAVVDREKALDWAKGQKNASVAGADTDAWSVLALSRKDRDIALLVGPGYVFFGVAGRGGEVYPRDMEKAFGKDLGKLRNAVRQEISGLWKDGVMRVEGADVQKIHDAVGLGILEKVGRDWTLKSADCQAVDLPASGL